MAQLKIKVFTDILYNTNFKEKMF